LQKKYEKDIVKFAQKIIQTPSFLTKEGELIKLVKREMESAAFYMRLTREKRLSPKKFSKA